MSLFPDRKSPNQRKEEILWSCSELGSFLNTCLLEKDNKQFFLEFAEKVSKNIYRMNEASNNPWEVQILNPAVKRAKTSNTFIPNFDLEVLEAMVLGMITLGYDIGGHKEFEMFIDEIFAQCIKIGCFDSEYLCQKDQRRNDAHELIKSLINDGASIRRNQSESPNILQYLADTANDYGNAVISINYEE